MAPSVLDGALLSLPHPVFDLGEGLFDRVEVGRVWRQVPEPGASSLDHLSDSSRLVASEIVENDDVASRRVGRREDASRKRESIRR